MSGRAYARDPLGGVGGATDINSFIPHRFRIAAPKAATKAKELAIRRAIQRKCKEKNWKKVLLIRQTRLAPVEMPELGAAASTLPVKALAPTPVPNADEKSTDTADAPVVNGVDSSQSTSPITPADEQLSKEREEIDQAKQQLLEMEEKLKLLSHEKHEKFQQLKDLLIAEARAKSAPTPAKKRRLETAMSFGGAETSPRMTGATGEGDPPLGPGPGLMRAQSYGGPTSTFSPEFRHR